MTRRGRSSEQPPTPTPRAPEELEEKPGAGGCVPPASPSITSLFAGEQMSVLAKKRSDRGRRSAFHMTCPGTEDVFVNPASCQFSLFTKGINHLLLLSPLTPDPPARPPLCRLEEAGKQFRLHLPLPAGGCTRGPPLAPPAWGAAAGDPPKNTETHTQQLPRPHLRARRLAWQLLRGDGGCHKGSSSLPPALPGCRSSWLEPTGCGEGVLGAAPRGPPGQNSLMRGDKSSLGSLAGTGWDGGFSQSRLWPGTKPPGMAQLLGAGVDGVMLVPRQPQGAQGVTRGDSQGRGLSMCRSPCPLEPSTRTPRRGRCALEQLDAVTLGLYITQIAACSSFAAVRAAAAAALRWCRRGGGAGE